MCACNVESSAALQLLLCAAPQLVNAQNHHGDTALHIAVEAGSMDCISALLEAGASHNISNIKVGG